MNENIIAFIDKYTNIDNPGYALMLNGGWGCGKTHFVKEWMANQKKSEKEDNLHIVLKPIYVSLFGKKTIDQVVYDIKKEITPWLYSKEAKVCKKLISCFSQAALHVDINKDGKDDGELTFGFDPLSLLGEGNNTENIKGRKILIFDDLERCQIDMKEILGFINYLVEHNGCKVIVVCDECHLDDKQRQEYGEYREKTFGRTFSVKGDASVAYDAFVEDVKYVAYNKDIITELKNTALQIYDCSHSSNLRALRQTIHDFAIAGSFIIKQYAGKPKLNEFLKTLFIHFQILHLEDSNGNRENFELFAESVSNIFTDEDDKGKINWFLSKYTPWLDANNVPRLNGMLAADVLSFDKDGVMRMNFANPYFGEDTETLSAAQDIIKNLHQMDNEILVKQEALVVKALRACTYEKLNELVADIICMSSLDVHKVSSYAANDIKIMSENAIDSYLNNLNPVPEDFKQQALKCISYYQNSHLNNGVWKDIKPYYEAKVDKICGRIVNRMQMFWLNIDNNNIDDIVKIWKDPLPDHSTLYEDAPMFKGLDADVLTQRILSLNNGALNSLSNWLRYFYSDNGRPVGWEKKLSSDVPMLQLMKNAIDNEVSNKIKLDKLAYEKMSKALGGIIQVLAKE